jgi:hypothetical protein
VITFASCTTTSTVTVQTYTSTPIQPINNSTNTTVNRVLVEKQLASLSLSTTTNESPAAVSGKIKVNTNNNNNNKQPPQINIKQNAENSNPQQQHTTHQYAPVPHQATPHTKVTNPQISSNKPKQLNFDNPALSKPPPPQIMSSTATNATNGREARSKVVKNANSSQPTGAVKQPIATAKSTTTTKNSDHSPEFSSTSSSSESSSTNSSSESLSVTSSYSLASSSNTTTETTNSTNNNNNNNYTTASMAAPMSVTSANNSGNNNFVMPTRVTRNSGKTTTSKETTVCHKPAETAQVACGHNSRVTAAANNQDMVFIPPRTPVRSKTRESQYTTPSKLVSKSG